MKKLIISGLLCLGIISCEDKSPVDREIERVFFENAQISLSENAGVYPLWEGGSNLVFRFTLKHPDEPNIADDELSEIFWIEIPSNRESFELSKGKSDDADFETIYTRACYCFIPEAFEFDHLMVRGNKISDEQWSITFEMSTQNEYGTYELNDSGNYTVSTFN